MPPTTIDNVFSDIRLHLANTLTSDGKKLAILLGLTVADLQNIDGKTPDYIKRRKVLNIWNDYLDNNNATKKTILSNALEKIGRNDIKRTINSMPIETDNDFTKILNLIADNLSSKITELSIILRIPQNKVDDELKPEKASFSETNMAYLEKWLQIDNHKNVDEKLEFLAKKLKECDRNDLARYVMDKKNEFVDGFQTV